MFRILLHDEKEASQKETVCNPDLYKDLEIFCGNHFDHAQTHLLSIIDHTKTIIGRIALDLLAHQGFDKEILQEAYFVFDQLSHRSVGKANQAQ